MVAVKIAFAMGIPTGVGIRLRVSAFTAAGVYAVFPAGAKALLA